MSIQLDYMDYIRMEKGFSELFVIADLLLDLSDMYYSDDYDDYLESISGKDSNTMRKTHKQLVKHKHQLLGIMSEEDIQLCVREAAEFF